MEQKVKTANELTVMKSFRDVELSAPFNVVITKSNECVVTVECDDADMDKINVRVENGALRIKSDSATAVMKTSKRGGFFGRFFGNSIVQTQKGGDNCCQVQISANGSIVAMNGSVINCSNGNIATGDTLSSEVTVRIGMPVIHNLTVEGSGNITVKDAPFYEWGCCNISVNGSGDIDINGILSEFVRLSIGGSGDISAKNVKANTLDVCINGSGDVSIKKAEAEDVYNTINGSGDITYKHLDSMHISDRVNGSGDINY